MRVRKNNEGKQEQCGETLPRCSCMHACMYLMVLIDGNAVRASNGIKGMKLASHQTN
jgi:hypothetical protein